MTCQKKYFTSSPEWAIDNIWFRTIIVPTIERHSFNYADKWRHKRGTTSRNWTVNIVQGGKYGEVAPPAFTWFPATKSSSSYLHWRAGQENTAVTSRGVKGQRLGVKVSLEPLKPPWMLARGTMGRCCGQNIHHAGSANSLFLSTPLAWCVTFSTVSWRILPARRHQSEW